LLRLASERSAWSNFALLEAGVAEICAAQVGLPQRGGFHFCMPQVRATQARVIHIRALQIGVAQIGLPKIGAPRRDTRQLGIRKVGSFAALPIGTQPGTVLSKDPGNWSNGTSLSTGFAFERSLDPRCCTAFSPELARAVSWTAIVRQSEPVVKVWPCRFRYRLRSLWGRRRV
jgi:hypothetical protein